MNDLNQAIALTQKFSAPPEGTPIVDRSAHVDFARSLIQHAAQQQQQPPPDPPRMPPITPVAN